MAEHSITVVIDDAALQNYTDAWLAQCWHVAQANPADDADSSAPGKLVEAIGREIIRRWLTSPIAGPELYRHTGDAHYWSILRRHGSWPGPDHKTWMPHRPFGAGDQA